MREQWFITSRPMITHASRFLRLLSAVTTIASASSAAVLVPALAARSSSLARA
jgi:hypothetical protein